MKKVYITYLDHLGKYQDRFHQVCEAIPHGVEGIIYTKAIADCIVPAGKSIRLIELPSKLTYRSVMLQWQLLLRVKREARGARVVVQDWFKNFALVLLLRRALGLRLHFLYSPVTSDFGWFYKRFKGMVPNCDLRFDWIRSRAVPLDYWVTRRCDSLVVQSAALMDFYRQAYGIQDRDVSYCYNGNAFQGAVETLPRAPGSPVQLGFVGNFEKHKGALELAELARALPPGFVLRIAGRARGRSDVRLFEQIRSLPNVRIEGELSRERIETFYGEIDALLLFSYHEGSPRVVREFLAYGKPMFLYDNPGLDYCRGLAGVHVYAYDDFGSVLADIKSTDFGARLSREHPAVLEENQLKKILEKRFSP